MLFCLDHATSWMFVNDVLKLMSVKMTKFAKWSGVSHSVTAPSSEFEESRDCAISNVAILMKLKRKVKKC